MKCKICYEKAEFYVWLAYFGKCIHCTLAIDLKKEMKADDDFRRRMKKSTELISKR